MKAFVIDKYKSNEDLKLIVMPEPAINDHEVLVEVYAAGVNQLDSKIKSGEFKLLLPYKLPLILGHDVAGIIRKVGKSVKRFKEGDEVFARPADFKIGTFAEYIAIKENDISFKPKNMTMEEAASFPLVALTVWQAFIEKANLQKGQKVFIQAGSGGVGTVAIQLAKHLGATVATTTSAKNSNLVKSLGADIVIDYKTQDFETLLKDYDLVLNSQDGKTLEKSLRILKPGGMAISISGPPDPTFAKEMGLNWLMKAVMFFLSRKVRRLAKTLAVNYTFLFMKDNGEQLSSISSLIESGTIRPIIDKVFAFADTNEAVKYVSGGNAKGKVIVKVK